MAVGNLGCRTAMAVIAPCNLLKLLLIDTKHFVGIAGTILQQGTGLQLLLQLLLQYCICVMMYYSLLIYKERTRGLLSIVLSIYTSIPMP